MANDHLDCPFEKNERFYNEKIKQFDKQLETYGRLLDDLRDFKNKIIGASLLGSFLISLIVSIIMNSR